MSSHEMQLAQFLLSFMKITMVMVNIECDAAILVEMRRRDETERLNDTLAASLLQKRYSQQQSATNDCTVG